MKPAYLFRDQVNALSVWFKEWNDCEQTVALYSLLRRVTPTQARFLTLVLEQTLSDADECLRLEQEANDIGFVCNLCNESKDMALAQLLSHLPLLRPGNNEVKQEYLNLIPKILLHSVENSQHLEESRQVLSFLLIHPALSNEDRSSLAWWLGRLEEHTNSQVGFQSRLQVSPDLSPSQSPSPSPSPFPGGVNSETGRNGLQGGLNGWRGQTASRDIGVADLIPSSSHYLGGSVPHQPLTNTLSAPPAVNVTGPSNDVASGIASPSLPLHQRNRRSNSLTPPNSCSNTPSPQPPSDWPSQEELETRSGRSLSLPNEHAPLSPQSSTASSGSSTEAHGEEGLWNYGGSQLGPQKRNSFLEENSGMRDVPSWLKSLRLHKYSGLFQQLTYDEMMLLNECQLESMNVTKGARHKIVLSIQKLKERQQTLNNLEKDIINDNSPSNLRNALNEVKSMLNTPIKVYDPQESSKDDPTSQSAEDGEREMKEGDFPGQLTRFMGKMCTQLLVAKRPDEDNVSLYLQLLDKSLNHEAFTAAQKKRFLSWRQSCQKFSRNPYPRKLSLQETKQPRTWGHYGTNYPAEYSMFAPQGPGGTRRLARQPFVSPQAQGQGQPQPQRISSLLATGGGPTLFRPTQTSNMYMKPRQQLPGNPHIGVQRTKSAPIRRSSQPVQPFMYQAPPPQDSPNQPMGDPEITNRLETLCLSMTEHALSDGAEHSNKGNRN